MAGTSLAAKLKKGQEGYPDVSTERSLILTAPVAFGRIYLMPILAEFLLSYPEIDIRLLLDERIFNFVEQIDLALRVGVLPDSRLIALPLGTIRGQVMCASPAYLASRGTPSVPEDLTAHDCIIDAGVPTPTLGAFLRDKDEIAIPKLLLDGL